MEIRMRPSADVSNANWLTSTGGTTNLFAEVDDLWVHDSDGSYIVSSTAGAAVQFQLLMNIRQPDTTVAFMRFGMSACVTGGGYPTAVVRMLAVWNGLSIEVGRWTVFTANYAEWTVDYAANPFGGPMPVLGAYQLIDRTGADWRVQIEIVSTTAPVRISMVYVSLETPGFDASPQSVEVAQALDTVSAGQAPIGQETVHATDTGLGARLVAVDETAGAADAATKLVTFRNAIRTGGDRPSRYRGDLPRQA